MGEALLTIAAGLEEKNKQIKNPEATPPDFLSVYSAVIITERLH